MAVHWYVGVTGSGKTTRALQDVADDIRKTGWPALVIDSQGVRLLASIKHRKTWKEVVRDVWIERKNSDFIPRDAEEGGAVFSVARELGKVIILLDEAAFWMSSRSMGPKALERAFRTHFHWGGGKGGIIRATTQHLADLAPVAIQCTTTIKTFRCTSARILERLKQEFQYNPDEIEKLERGQFIEKGSGF